MWGESSHETDSNSSPETFIHLNSKHHHLRLSLSLPPTPAFNSVEWIQN